MNDLLIHKLVGMMSEAQSHLSTALVQVLESDDQIIVGHVREADAILRTALSVVKTAVQP